MNILDIYDRGVLQLNELFGEMVRLKIRETTKSQLEGTLTVGDQTTNFCAVMHKGIAPLRDLSAGWRRAKLPDRVLIVPPLGEEARTACKSDGIQFIDGNGNCFLRFGTIRMHVERSVSNAAFPSVGSGKAFQANGLKFLLAIYQQPQLLNATYREISAQTGISTGALTPIFEDLRANNFLLGDTSDNNLSLFNETELTRRFAYNFLVDVRPKLHRGQFYLHDTFAIETLKEANSPQTILLGGLHAAELRGVYLSASQFSLYSDARIADLVKAHRIIPKSATNTHPYPVIDVFHAFGGEYAAGTTIGYRLVSDLVIYAELLSTQNTRALDAAERLLTHEIFAKYQANRLQYKRDTDVLSAAS